MVLTASGSLNLPSGTVTLDRQPRIAGTHCNQVQSPPCHISPESCPPWSGMRTLDLDGVFT